jgi:signal transduction histidine kinase
MNEAGRWPAPDPSPPAAEVAELQRHVNAGRLAAAVSHEVMSALGVVQSELGYLCDLMGGAFRSAEDRSMAVEARAAMSSAVQRVAAVVSLARARPCEIGPVDVKEMVNAAIFELDARLRGFAIVRDLRSVPLALADRGALLQTLVSLLLDAADATPGRGQIRIGLRPEGSDIVVTIEDEGPAPHSDAALGLARAVVRAFGGELTVSAAAEPGRRLSLRLPAA